MHILKTNEKRLENREALNRKVVLIVSFESKLRPS